MTPTLLLLALQMNAPPTNNAPAAAKSAAALLQRLLGPRAGQFQLSDIQNDAGQDVFVVSARGGRVSVAGSSGVAIARGAYHYLRQACHACVTWEGDHLELPAALPDFPETRVVCSHAYRHYFNVCTFGYTMAFWDWPRWEREIDWMALHGINMPLAMTGQEAVWQKLWREFGLSDRQIRAFFTGPAFLPWHWMGNIDSHCGPMPQSFIDFQIDLQKRILARERELGMTPVVPAFAGFVPGDFAVAHPQAKIARSTAWAGFEPTYLLQPGDPLFQRIGRRFIEMYRETYGDNAGAHLYLADVFNEMTPPVAAATKYDDLRASAAAIFDSIRGGDPEGIWVSQGWLFYNEASFWQTREVESYLGGVPDDRMIVLDLSCERMEVWRRHAAARRKGWIWNLLHNFGGHTALFGDGRGLIEKWAAAMKEADAGRRLGMGLTMEGIEQNSWLYELATDLMWRREPPTFDAWIEEWCAARYGANPPAAVVQAWRSVPVDPYPAQSGAYLYRPSPNAAAEPGSQIEEDRRRTELMLSCADSLGGNPLYQHDLVDVMKRFLARCADIRLYEVTQAFDAGDAAALTRACDAYLDLLEDIDALLGTRPEYRLSRWIAMARQRGTTPEERNFMERNARTQITVWGGPVLHDYAAKEWSGLVRGMYAGRMRLFFRAMEDALAARRAGRSAAGTQPAAGGPTTSSPASDPRAERAEAAIWAEFAEECAAWEQRWAEDVSGFAPPRGRGTVALAQALFDRCRALKPPLIDRGLAVGKPTRDSGHTEPGGDPSFAVDGSASGRYWAASPAPQWWQVDLEKPTMIGRIQVFPYRDGARYYQYTVEVSLDGERWTRVADMSGNTRPATARGETHAIAPTQARYVRVNMLRNSANVGVHLHEVRVFGPAAVTP